MKDYNSRRAGIAWLELLLAIATLTLFLQFFPELAFRILSDLDLRTWTTATWFWAFAAFLLFLLSIRFGPEITEGFRDRRGRIARERSKCRPSQLDGVAKLKQDEERKLYQRIIEARKRQVI